MIGDYLDLELKAQYQKDFFALKKLPDGDAWAIDKGIEETLESINSNRFIQTLYSKCFTPSEGQFVIEAESYLEFAYIREVESVVQISLQRLRDKYPNNLTWLHCEPTHNANMVSESNRRTIGCLTNPDYFNLYHYKVSFNDTTPANHHQFWKDIAQELKGIKTAHNNH